MNEEKNAQHCSHGAVQKRVDEEQDEEFDVCYAHAVVYPAGFNTERIQNTGNGGPFSQCTYHTRCNGAREVA